MCKKLTLFKSLAAIFFFDKSQKKMAAREADGGYRPCDPIRNAEYGKQKTEFVKIRFFVNLTILLAKKAGDSSVGLRLPQNDGGLFLLFR